ncbi:uncharacterized protein EI90DRAFT_3157890 [Cantharellus anzutake]|uniref:uncharacterized protein n=1 Tax=Cantharellus anzutake TaxID=1750568 RepID=UPI001904ABBD|nr:uncharacterized protein EI90DRAFT_3157890 [Cantharellus anzutake]KAF8321482.1 hypothetical protein EI90DRAFT_3157890 [Cantharellus anzutake]
MSHVAAQTASPTDGKKANETTTPNILPPTSQQQTFTLPSSPSSPPSFKLPPDLDLTRPISQLLREGTADVHTAVEDSEGAQLLTQGQLGNREYTRVLFMLWHIYDELERGLYEHREHPVLYHIYHPRVFSRASALSFDICHHLGTVTWQTDPFYVSFYNNIPKPVQAYIDRLSYLGRSEATSEEVSCLAAHAYVRYLGDLSGGQMIRRKLIKSYGLYEDGEGSAFYNFRTLDYRTGDRPAEMHEIRKIKAWFKEGLDEAVTDPKLKELVIAEAHAAFLYNGGLFSCIDTTQTLEKENELKAQSASAYPGAHITQTLLRAGNGGGVMTSVGAFAALVVLAACGAHLVLTMGGVTGEGGKKGLEGVYGWLVSGFARANGSGQEQASVV